MTIFGVLKLLCWLLLPVSVAGAIAGVARKTGIALALVALVALVALSGVVQVDAGHVGVVKTFGEVHPQQLPPGIHYVRPFVDSVEQLDTRLKNLDVPSGASSKDLQVVNTVVSVQHSLAGDWAPKALQNVGDLEKFDGIVVGPAILEAMKAITAKYTAEELVTKREEVKHRMVQAIQANIDNTLEEKGVKGALIISNVAIKDFDFSDGFNHSIEAKVKAQQEALRALNDKTRRVTLAEAEAKERELLAEAEAYSITKLSEAQAAAIEREAKALQLNPNLIRLRMIQTWNGQLPTFSGNGQVLPFINVDQFRQPSPAPQNQAAPATGSK